MSKASYPKLNSKLKFNSLLNFKKEKLQKINCLIHYSHDFTLVISPF